MPLGESRDDDWQNWSGGDGGGGSSILSGVLFFLPSWRSDLKPRAGDGNTIGLLSASCSFAVGGVGGGDGSWTPPFTTASDDNDDCGFPFTSVTGFPLPVPLSATTLAILDSFEEPAETVTSDAEDNDWVVTVLHLDDAGLHAEVTATLAAGNVAGKPFWGRSPALSWSSSLLGRNWPCPLSADDCNCRTMPSAPAWTFPALTSCFLATASDSTSTAPDLDRGLRWPWPACSQQHTHCYYYYYYNFC